MAKSAFIKPVRSDSLSRQVFESLKEAIFSGKFRPGEAVRELHLAKMFEVSQATIREALVQLEHTGLVTREQNRKTTITSLTRAELAEKIEVRCALEEVAFIKAAAHISEADQRKLATLSQAVDKAIEKGSLRETALVDLRFHQYVWERADSPLLGRLLNVVSLPLFAFQGILQESGLQDAGTQGAHERLIEALQTQSDDSIRAAVREHLSLCYRPFLESGIQSLSDIPNN